MNNFPFCLYFIFLQLTSDGNLGQTKRGGLEYWTRWTALARTD